MDVNSNFWHHFVEQRQFIIQHVNGTGVWYAWDNGWDDAVTSESSRANMQSNDQTKWPKAVFKGKWTSSLLTDARENTAVWLLRIFYN